MGQTKPGSTKAHTKTLGYLRTSTDRQDINAQKLELLEYARREGFVIDDFLEVQASTRKTPKQRRIEELTERLNSGDTLIATELSRIGRSTDEVIALIKALLARDVNVIIVKQGLKLGQANKDGATSKIMVTLLSLFAELERDLISQRTREALRTKKSCGIQLGKPKGTIQASIFDAHREKIQELLRLGVSVRRIAMIHLGIKNYNNLNEYVRKRGLRHA